ncbi:MULTISPECIES: hypothetical protein [Serratia]|nr:MULTISPECIES: hypothetical protein [Serratia]ANM77109.1 hypothetical protein A4U88_1469 [Serratia marcescens]AXK26673.1 Hypothetical protein SmN45_4964 [Serratia marcescens]MDK1710353.1 hypothetical protein [Serratia marcescens]MDV5750966.1 hypothetical protein [Serratia marcescens]
MKQHISQAIKNRLGAAYPLEYDNVYHRNGSAVIFKVTHEKSRR